MPAGHLSHFITDELRPPSSVALDWQVTNANAVRGLRAELYLPPGTEFGVAHWLMDW